MKIKMDFVTNSSSINYIISSPSKVTKKQLSSHPAYAIEDLESFSKVEDLIKYTQNEECDWIDKITGPRNYWNLNREWYDASRKILDEGKIVTHLAMNRNYGDQIQRIERDLKEGGHIILIREND